MTSPFRRERKPSARVGAQLPRMATRAYRKVPSRVRSNVLLRGLTVLARGAWQEPAWFIFAMLGGGAFALLQVITASVMGWITSTVIYPGFERDPGAGRHLAMAVLILIGLGILRASAVLVRRLGSGFLQYNLIASLRQRMVRRLAAMPMGWHRRQGAGQLLSRSVSDAEITWLSMGAFPFAASTVLMLAFGLTSILLSDVWLGLVAGALIPAILLLNLLYQSMITPRVLETQAARAHTTGVAHESLDGAELVKVLGHEEAEVARFQTSARALAEANIRVGRIRSWFDPILESLPNLGAISMVVVGTWRIAGGRITAGDIVEATYLLGIMAVPLQSIGFVLSTLGATVVGHDRVRKVLTAHSDMRFGRKLVPRKPDDPAQLVLDEITFAYADQEGGVHRSASLKDVTMRVDDREGARIVAVVGKTGSGKSTLTYVASRLLDPTEGVVRMDGIDLRDFAEGELYQDVSLVLQEPFIFNLSVRDNVLLGYPAPDREVWHALRVAQADRFVADQPDGLDAVLGERGGRLSGGQRQRIALARALVRRPRVMILDDATSAVDPVVEAQIIAGLRRHVVYSSVVMVAYRKSAITLADEVVFMDGGSVMARGTHEELLSSCAPYRDLVNAYDEADTADQLLEGTDS